MLRWFEKEGSLRTPFQLHLVLSFSAENHISIEAVRDLEVLHDAILPEEANSQGYVACPPTCASCHQPYSGISGISVVVYRSFLICHYFPD